RRDPRLRRLDEPFGVGARPRRQQPAEADGHPRLEDRHRHPAGGRPMTTIRQDVGELRAPVTTFAPTDRTQSRKLVLVSVAVILALNVYRSGREPGSLYKRLWGTGVLGVALSIVADFAPQVAGPFAMLVA